MSDEPVDNQLMMVKTLTLTENIKKDSNLLIYLFYVWTFVLIARPQDFIDALTPIRPALSVGIIVVIVYVFYHALYRNKLLDNQQCRLYLYFLATIMISIPFAYYRRGAFEFVFTKYISAVLFFFLFYKLINNTRTLNNILWTSCFGSGLYLLCALYQGEMVSGRLNYGRMFDPNDLAYFAVSFLPLNFLFISKKEQLWKRLLCVLNVVVSIVMILMTGSRGGFIALGIVVLMLFIAESQIIKKSYKVIIAAITIVALIYGGTAIDLSRLDTITNIGEDYNVWDETGRFEVWKKGLDLMLSNPLTGVGVSCFSEAIGRERLGRGLQEIWQAPHNVLVQIGAETGIIGLILFVVISVKAFRIFGMSKSAGKSEQINIMGGIAMIGFTGHFISSMFLSQAYSIYWVFFIALSASISELLRNEPQTVR